MIEADPRCNAASRWLMRLHGRAAPPALHTQERGRHLGPAIQLACERTSRMPARPASKIRASSVRAMSLAMKLGFLWPRCIGSGHPMISDAKSCSVGHTCTHQHAHQAWPYSEGWRDFRSTARLYRVRVRRKKAIRLFCACVRALMSTAPQWHQRPPERRHQRKRSTSGHFQAATHRV
jgi:hypothetical protein